MKPFLILRGSTPLAYFLGIWGLVKTVTSAEEGMPTITSTDGTGRDVIYKGSIITIDAIHLMINELVSRWKTLLEEGIFAGCRSPCLSIHIPSVLVDMPRNTDVGFCFLDLPANKLVQFQHVLITHLLEHPSLQGNYFYQDGDKMVGIKPQLLKLLRIEEEMTDIMMVIIQITGGNPGRGTEVVNHLLRNLPGGSIRNFFNLYNLCMIIGGYSKTSNMTSRDKVIPRVPPPAYMILFLYHFIVVRPAMELFAEICRGARAAARYRYFLYPALDAPRTSDSFSHTLAEYTQEFLGTALPVSDWRQCAAGFSRLNGNVLNMKRTADFTPVQFGNTAPTFDRWYGITPDMILSVTQERIIGCITQSGGWHVMFGLGNDVLRAIEHVSDGDPGVGTSNGAGVSDKGQPMDYQRIARMTADAMRDDICHEVRTNMAQMAALYWPKPEMPSGTKGRSLVPYPHRLYALRAYLRDWKATFRDEQQAYALELVIQREKNVLVVLPTGELSLCSCSYCLGLNIRYRLW